MDASLVFQYFPELTDLQKKQIEKLGSLYTEWNAKINVISRKDIDELYVRHVLHSLSIAKFTSFKDGTKFLDVGTGGGFPGIPLAIFFPNVHFHLVDSIGKKIQVVQEVANGLGLQNVEAEHNRMEKIKGKYDFVISRAVAQTKQLVIWTRHLIAQKSQNEMDNGWILLKGGELEAEMREAKMAYQMINIADYFKEDFFETKKVIYIPN